jgi:hypothetical protein
MSVPLLENDMEVRLIAYEDLTRCEMCEDAWCGFHEKHFYDCDCQLEEWYEYNQKLEEDSYGSKRF